MIKIKVETDQLGLLRDLRGKFSANIERNLEGYFLVLKETTDETNDFNGVQAGIQDRKNVSTSTRRGRPRKRKEG